MRTLVELGLSESDLEMYVSLLRLGSAPLRRVAEEASLNRGTAYDSLKRLMRAGLVSYMDAKTHRHFIAEDPHKLRGLVTRKEEALLHARAELDSAIPALSETARSGAARPAVRYVEGVTGVRDLLLDVLTTTERAESMLYRVYSAAQVRDLISDAWPTFTKERIKRNVRVHAIAVGKGGTGAELAERRWLNKDAKAPSYIFIYPGKTAFVSADLHKRLFGIVMDDPALSKTQELVFDTLWQTLE